MPVQPIASFKSGGTRSMSTSYASWTLTNAGKATALRLSNLTIYVNTISSATTLTCKISRDSSGDELIVPEWEIDLIAGQTTAADGTAISILDDLALGQSLSTVYLWVKTDAGTCTGSEAILSGLVG